MSTESPPAGRESFAAAKVQILATEHWSLLATRSLTYSEALSRVTIFLTILSGAVIALALVAQADHFGSTFIWIAIPLLSIVLFAGIVTIGRLTALNRDDYRWVVAMNRLRHAYLELDPTLEPYFTTSPHDDLHGALQTLPGMLTVLVAAIAGAIGALVAVAIAVPPAGASLTAAIAFVVVVLWVGLWGQRSGYRPSQSLAARFPSPDA